MMKYTFHHEIPFHRYIELGWVYNMYRHTLRGPDVSEPETRSSLQGCKCQHRKIMQSPDIMQKGHTAQFMIPSPNAKNYDNNTTHSAVGLSHHKKRYF
ncbi:hypothetical protein VTN49DRAFT_5666 [Thermomyces lanuginosus]|uniref:uncharacterized protein n=1 Tax=Thermomyces lanuginosus TaxID=5541 RepID=UPI0037440AEC